jgi:hypothetical protein
MRNLIWGFILVSVGLLILLDNLGYADFGEILHDYWPLLLILWGIGILMRRNSARVAVPPAATPPPPVQPVPEPSPAFTPPPPMPATSGTESAAGIHSGSPDLIHDSNVFGDVHTQVTSQNFKGGSISTVFGNGIVDLSNASIAPGDHELRIHGVFGNLTIVLRHGMAASISANTLFGDVVNLGQSRSGISPDVLTATSSFTTATNRLKISAHAVFGSIRVS